MMTKRRLAFGLCLLAGVALAGYAKFFWVRAHVPAPSSIARLGKQLPALPVFDASGSQVDIGKIARGSKSVIAFYSGSCGVCQEVLPHLQPFPSTLRLILVDTKANRPLRSPDALRFGEALLFHDRNDVLSRSFPMSGIPTILFVDERGILRDGLVGRHALSLLQRKLKEFAESRP